jgi:glycosyltransferase involved in cell wall biosynthesis
LKLLDYLKVGRSIVATDVEANRLILDEKTALLATPNPSAMAAAIISLVSDADRREKMGLQGRKLYETKYNFREYTKRLTACYAFVLNTTK